jgi:flagellar basal-body rod protein FlgG
MNSGSYIALSGILAEERMLNAVSNNLSNVNTVGYKSSNVTFAEFLSPQAIAASQSGGDKPLADKAYPIALNTYNDMSQGSLKKTGNRLDFAIKGSGYFAVITPVGIKYTRNGEFSLNQSGELVTQNGFPVLNTEKKPVFLNERGSNVTVTDSGIISLTDPQTNNESYSSQLLTVKFKNPEYLSKYGDTLFSTTKSSGEAVQEQNPDIIQGYLEESNVNEIKGMVQMINISETYNNMIQALKSYSTVDNTAITTVGAAV